MLQLDYQENGRVTGQLVLKNTPRFAPLRAKPSVISIIPAFANDRAEVEKFITDIYAQAYDASIAVHYPILMSVRNAQGKILAATGFRSAACEKLFLENYLDAPIEALAGVPREKIVEVGNLASNGGGASLFLFAAISAYLHNKVLKRRSSLAPIFWSSDSTKSAWIPCGLPSPTSRALPLATKTGDVITKHSHMS